MQKALGINNKIEIDIKNGIQLIGENEGLTPFFVGLKEDLKSEFDNLLCIVKMWEN